MKKRRGRSRLATTQPTANVSHWISHPKTWKLNYKTLHSTTSSLQREKQKVFVKRSIQRVQKRNFQFFLKTKTKIIIVRGGSEAQAVGGRRIWLVIMEGVGARLGRSSTRYGPATVFTGPVRKWKKKWVHVSPSSASSNSNNNTNHNHGSSNGNNNGSHLLLYKWTPITQSQNANNNGSNGNVKDAPLESVEEPPRRKFKYIPVFSFTMHSFYEFSLGFYWMKMN